MSSYKANLDLTVTSKGVKAADKGLTRIEKQGARAERSTDKVTASFKRLIGPVVAFVTATAGLKKIADVTRQNEIFSASLKTATGSAKDAAVAFEALEEFAKRTPYQLDQSVEAFVKLVNLGLTPSERALTSYGDTAAAMGKDLTQFIEAVADASTNEFERLKEFGIKASQQADSVSFTFKGVTTTVGKSATEIEEYLTQLGENNFAGAMAERMAGLDGAISNLSDQWDRMFREISAKGIDDLMISGVNLASEAIEDFTYLIESGGIERGAELLAAPFINLAPMVDDATGHIERAFEYWGDMGGEVSKFITENFDTNLSHIPENIRSMIQLAVVEFQAIGEAGDAYGKAFAQSFGAQLAHLVDKAGIYSNELLDILNVFDGDSFNLDAELAKSNALIADMTDGYFKAAEDQIKKTDETRRSSISAILDENKARTGAIDDEQSRLQKLREEYDKLNAARKAPSLDDVNTGDKGGEKVEKGPSLESQRDFEALIDKVIPPSDRINQVFENRLQLIRENTETGSEKQAELIQRLNKEYATDVMDGFDVEPGEYDFDAKVDLINEDFNRRREAVLSNSQLTEEARTELESKLTLARNQKLEAMDKQRYATQMGIAQGALGNLSSLMNSQSKKAFKIGKIAAIANATISGIEAAVHSYKFGAQFGGPALGAAFAATAAAATLVQIQSINSQQFGGGGTVSAGGGGSVPTNTYQPQQPTQQTGPGTPGEISQPVQFIFNGDVTGLDAETIGEMLKDHIDQTDFVLIESGTRNADELRAA